DVNRLENGSMPLRVQEIPWTTLCEPVLAEAGLMAQAKAVSLNRSGENHALVRCDPGLGERILLNLLDNAIGGAPDRSVVDVHSAAPSPRTRPARAARRRVRLRDRDPPRSVAAGDPELGVAEPAAGRRRPRALDRRRPARAEPRPGARRVERGARGLVRLGALRDVGGPAGGRPERGHAAPGLGAGRRPRRDGAARGLPRGAAAARLLPRPLVTLLRDGAAG